MERAMAQSKIEEARQNDGNQSAQMQQMQQQMEQERQRMEQQRQQLEQQLAMSK